MFCYPYTFEPVLTFFSLKDLPSQDVAGVRSAINAALNNISMPELASKVVFLASDGVCPIELSPGRSSRGSHGTCQEVLN